jgi:hypothetical protein
MELKVLYNIVFHLYDFRTACKNAYLSVIMIMLNDLTFPPREFILIKFIRAEDYTV